MLVLASADRDADICNGDEHGADDGGQDDDDGYQNDNPQKSFEGLANTGSTDGKILPETVYFYVIDLGETDVDGNEISEDSRIRKGIVYIRKPNE